MAKQRGVSDLAVSARLCRERGHDWGEPFDVVTARQGGRVASFTRTRKCRRNEEHVQVNEDISVRTGTGNGAVTKCDGDYYLHGVGRYSRTEMLVENLNDGVTTVRG